ncbi:hypothetical protein [Mycoplasma sp. ATU-Cv-508]|uniref:hypothetical protein n=1 Tax=Mycoplasma sp. ATU-Cv-508 TaxID=2048001 RepID=UPI0031F2FBAE
MHPGQSAEILLNKQKIGYLGQLHPAFYDQPVYFAEINLTHLAKLQETKALTFSAYQNDPLKVRDLTLSFKPGRAPKKHSPKLVPFREFGKFKKLVATLKKMVKLMWLTGWADMRRRSESLKVSFTARRPARFSLYLSWCLWKKISTFCSSETFLVGQLSKR